MSLGNQGSLKNEVNTIYLAAASVGDIPAVSKEVTRLLPGTFVTTASSLAGQVTGSLTSAVKLVHDLDGWLTELVLAAAFAVASLLTLAAVARRAREFGILKAIGWRSRRVIGQVLGESAAIGVAVPRREPASGSPARRSLPRSRGYACLNAWSGGPFVKTYTGGPETSDTNQYFTVFQNDAIGGYTEVGFIGDSSYSGDCIGDSNNNPNLANAGLVSCGTASGNEGWEPKLFMEPPDALLANTTSLANTGTVMSGRLMATSTDRISSSTSQPPIASPSHSKINLSSTWPQARPPT